MVKVCVQNSVKLVVIAMVIGIFTAVYAQETERRLPYFLRVKSEWATETLEGMTLEEKIAQSFMVPLWPNKEQFHLNEIDSLIKHYYIGGVVLYEGDYEQAKHTLSDFQNTSKYPLLVAMDAEYGIAQRVWSKKRFPFALTLGAANLQEQTALIYKAITNELNELGVHLCLGPVLDVNGFPNFPTMQHRSFGGNAAVVANLGKTVVQNLERGGVLSCMKHFPGKGEAVYDGTSIPYVEKSRQELEIIDWAPFKMGRLAGASSLMVSHINVSSVDPSGLPASLSKDFIQNYIREGLKFSGLVVCEDLQAQELETHFTPVERATMAYLAGNDVLLAPSHIKEVIEAIKKELEKGEITLDEINEKCLRVLNAKYHGIYKAKEKYAIDEGQLNFAITQNYEKAITVVKNNGAIPVAHFDQRIAVVNVGATFSGFSERVADYGPVDTYTAFTAEEVVQKWLPKLADYDVVLLQLYASTMSPTHDFNYPLGWRDLLEQLPAKPSFIVSFLGNPYALDENVVLNRVDGVIVGYENTPIVSDRLAQLIFGGTQAKTTLPVSLSLDMQMGHGITTAPPSRLKFTVLEELGISPAKLYEIDSIALAGIKAKAYPGCQIVAAKDGKVFYRKSFGNQIYEEDNPITNETVYDLASITKIASSTLGLMRLEDANKFSLDERLNTYLPTLTKGSPYASVSLKDMMAHRAGLTAWIPFYSKTLVGGKLHPDLYAQKPNDSMNYKVADNIYMLNSYEDSMYTKILGTRITPGNKYKYSDVGYYFVKKIIEQQTGSTQDQFLLSSFYAPMGLKTMRYTPLNYYDREIIAPTEKDTYFRYQLVHGYVHDMGAAMTNGVGGHAGLFSNATDLAALMQMLLNKGVYGGQRYLSEGVIDKYTACQFCPSNRRGAGFDKPTRDLKGGPTCELVSLASYGHSGFTGTQTWVDPEHGVNYVFLSNRVYPSAENWKLVKMSIRTEIQRVIYEALNID